MCSICEDTGWKPIEDGGVRRVVRCDCWRETVGRQRLDEARIPRRYERCALDDFQAYNESLKRAVQFARRLVDDFPAVDKGLLLLGLPGVGKTHIAVAALKDVIRRSGAHGLFYTTSELLALSGAPTIRASTRPSPRSCDPSSTPRSWSSTICGRERTSEWVEEMLHVIVNTRYSQGRIDDLHDESDLEADIAGSRIAAVPSRHAVYSRLYEMCEFLRYGCRRLSRAPDERQPRRSGDDVEASEQDAAGACGPTGPGAASRTAARRESGLEVAGRKGGELGGNVECKVQNEKMGHLAPRTAHPAPLGLYIHVPFCSAICNYCNFNRGLFDAPLKARYVDALSREIQSTRQRLPVDTIYFGGGTPSLLEPEEVARVVAACDQAFDVSGDREVTLEANPESVSEERLAAYRRAGVNRLSFGVQSFRDPELKRLSRLHTANRARAAFGEARRAGFDNVSLDLMMWLPAQGVDEWLASVQAAIELAPEHLSLYLLEVYPNAPLKDDMARSSWSQAPDDDAATMYLTAMERLDQAGYEQYEISNVARPGHRSRHNLKYWTDGEWLGFGCGAHSTFGGVRWKNVSATEAYLGCMERGESVAVDARPFSASEHLGEALFMGLRLADGIDLEQFRVRYGVDVWKRYADELERFLEGGHLERMDDRLRLTRAGMLLANEVMAVFV